LQVDPRAANEYVLCPGCDWRGWVWGFDPAPPQIDRPEQALPEDATCTHHPGKRAEAICAGTGDYICSLCAVTVNGETYSAAYLNRPEARQHLAGSWEQQLARPDRRIRWLVLLSIFPWCQAALAPLFVVWAGIEYVRMLHMRRNHPMYARLVGRASTVIVPLVLIGVLLAWTAVVVFFASVEGDF
jgi:hypothetical protein